jgi:hypothetical protein
MAQLMYELTFIAAASNTLADASEGCAMHSRDGVTVLRSAVADPAALHNLIDRIHTLGLELIEVDGSAARAEGDVESDIGSSDERVGPRQ